MYRGIFILSFLIALYFSAVAQNRDNEKPTYISVKDGLPDATITAICQDDDGFLWIGTSYGLSRYDGVEFKNYFHTKTGNSLPGNYVNALQILPAHRLLVATTTGLCLLNTHSNIFKNLVISAGAGMFGFENNFNAVATCKNGHIWAGTQTCLYELDTALHVLQRKFISKQKSAGNNPFLYVERIKALPGGEMLFRLQQGFKGSQYQWYVTENSAIVPVEQSKSPYKKILTATFMVDIAFTRQGDAWFIKPITDSLYFFNRRLNKITARRIGNVKGNFQFSYNSRISMINDQLWGCSLADAGMLVAGNALANNSGPQPGWHIKLPGKAVLSAFYDHANNLWAGTTNGLYKFPLAANSLSISPMPENDAKSGRSIELSNIFVTPGKTFLTTAGGGLFYKNNNNSDWKNIKWEQGNNTNNTWNVRAAADGNYWIGAQQGLFTWKPTDKLPVPLALPAAWQWINQLPVTTQFADRENLLWMGLGVGNGVAVYDLNNGNIKLYPEKNDGGFPLRYPIAVAEDEHGDIWMGGVEGRGLVHWTRKTDRFVLIAPEFNSNFDNGAINAIYADQQGSLWLATAGGLVKFDIKTKTFKKFDTTQGLSSNTLYNLTTDGAGRLWIGTKNGLNCMDMRTGKIFSFNSYYPNQDEPVNSVAYDAPANRLCFITPHSFYSINPNEWLKPRNPPQVFIQSATSSGQILNPSGNISLNYHNNNINIAFSAVNLVDGSQNKYFYRLNDTGTNWVPAGNTRQVSFSSLLPGKYTFSVKAQLPDGTWSKNVGVVKFSVAAPFWKTWWFILTNVALFACIIYLIYRYRINQIMRLQAIRSRIASDLHDDIGSTLSNIHILTELGHASLGENEKAGSFLTRIAEEVQASNQSLDDIVWSIDIQHDNFEEIAARMRRYAAELFEAANIIYKVHFDEKLSHKKISTEQRRDIYLIFKEAVNNIYKHAQAASVKISLETDRKFFKMTIIDDGKGFDVTAPTARNGLKNMKARAENSKGIFKVESAKGKGTSLFVTMQLFR